MVGFLLGTARRQPGGFTGRRTASYTDRLATIRGATVITAESSTSIDRPAARVFEFVSDVRNDPEWHTDILEARLSGDGPVAAGTTFDVRFKPFMGHSAGTMTVTEFAPPRRMVLRGKMGKMEPTLTLTVEPDGAGSRFTRRVEMEPPGIMRLMAPLMKGMFRKQNAGFVANLKRVLEAS